MSIDSSIFYSRQWELIKQAKRFPKLAAKANYTINFTLARTDFGWLYDRFDRRYTGPVLDLTGATIKLVGKILAKRPGMLDAARGYEWSSAYGQFDITGAIVSATDGTVNFIFDTDDTDTIGEVLAMIEITDASSNIIIPGYIIFYFLENLR